MKKLLFLLLIVPFLCNSQIGVNTTTPNAMLDVESTNNGVLISRVALTSITDAITVINPAGGALSTSTLVYNTATAGVIPDNVIPGFYYWNNTISRWIPIAGNTTSDHDWYEEGTTIAPDAITDNMFHTGKVAIGTATPASNAVFQVDLGTNATNGVLFTGTYNAAATVPNLGSGTRMMFFPGKSAFRVGHVDGNEWDNSNVGEYSVATGRNSIASGLGSSAFGYSYATGLYSTALGSSISNGSHALSSGIGTANGSYSLATGFTTANGNYSISGGNLSIANGNSSFAMGESTQANGDYSVAIGRNSIATGLGSSAFGYSSSTGLYSTALSSSLSTGNYSLSSGIGTANGDYSFATGFTTANGNYSISGGNLSVANGNSSFAMGESTQANGDYSVAIGRNSIATGLGSSALGYSSSTGLYSTALNSSFSNGNHSLSSGIGTANGDYSFATGFTNANGNYSISGGNLSVANGNNSFAMGQDVTAQSYGEISLGLANRPYTMSASGATTFNSNDHLFNLGNGNGSPHNALTVFKDGRINVNEEYTLPNIDGTANQVLQTDGAGNVTWQNATSGGWSLNGNASITSPAAPGTYGTSTIGATENFIGTTDNNDFTIGTDNIERMRIERTTGDVGIGIANPTEKLHVRTNSDLTKSSILGESIQTNAIGDFQNRGILGYGSGTAASGGFGFGIGVMGIGDRANSYYATGVYAHLGTVAPDAPFTNQALYANGNGLGRSAVFTGGNVVIQDGTQANGRVLTSNATGVATWQSPGIENVVGTLSATGVSIPYTLANFVQTGSSITLPPGRYAVNVTMLLARSTTTANSPNNSFFWVRSSFSDSAGINPLSSPDIIGSSLASGNFTSTSVYAMLIGTIVINNTTPGNKTYYYVAGRCVATNTTETLTEFGSTYWAEDNIIAYRLN